MYPEPYIEYLVYFHGPRDYFECHEVLEEFWKEKKAGERDEYWVGLIQISVALYHHRLGNFRGAKKLLNNAINIVQHNRDSYEQLGLHYEQLLRELKTRLQHLIKEEPYKSMNLPLTDVDLLKKCETLCENYNCSWGDPSNLDNPYLIKKHTLRDRSEVISEREKQRQLKKKRE